LGDAGVISCLLRTETTDLLLCVCFAEQFFMLACSLKRKNLMVLPEHLWHTETEDKR
jgi:hypothetical protein